MNSALAAHALIDEPEPLTVEVFLALPDADGVDRWLIQGQLVEREHSIPGYGLLHSQVQAQVTYLLMDWLEKQPAPRGAALSGASFCLRRQPATVLEADVSYLSAAHVDATTRDALLVEGAPVLAVEIVAPFDQNGDVADKIEAFSTAGAALVWRVEPALELITVFRPDTPPQIFSIHDEITAEPHLPSFRARVAEIFS